MPTFFTGSSKLVRATTSATLHTIATTDNATGVVNLRNDAAAHAFAVLDDASGSLPDRQVVIPPGKSVKLARGTRETTLKITNASVLATPGYLRKNDKFRDFINLSGAAQIIARVEALLGYRLPLCMAMDFTDCSAIVRDWRSKNNYVGDVNGLVRNISPSTKYIVGANGFYYPYDTIQTELDRFGNLLGARVEESAQNLIFPSTPSVNVFATNVTRTTGEIDIFGGRSALKATATTTAITQGPVFGGLTVNATSCSAWCIVKKGSGPTHANRFNLRNSSTSTNLQTFSINYDTGIITQTTGSGATATRLSNGWWLVQVGPSSGITSGNVLEWSVLFIGNTHTAGEFAYISHAQLEPGRTFATSPIVTTTAAVVRNTDNRRISTDTIPWDNTIFTGYGKYSTLIAASSLPNRGAFMCDLDNSNNRFAFRTSQGTGVGSLNYGTGAGAVGINLSNVQGMVTTKVAGAADASGAALYQDGIQRGTDASAFVGLTSFDLGIGGQTSGNAGPINGHLMELFLAPIRLDNTGLSVISTL